MSEDVEEGQLIFEGPDQFPVVQEISVVDAGECVYVCEVCGSELTEIPEYNRYYCEHCGLHY